MSRFLLLFFFGFSFALNPPHARAAGPGGTPPAAKYSPMFLQPAPTTAVADPANLIWIDSEQVNLSENGEVRSFRLKDAVKVTRNEFFDRYRLNLGLGKDDTMVERKVLDLQKVGWVVSRHMQKYKGLEVLGSEYVLREKEGRVEWAIGKITTGLNLDTTPQITEAQALESALNEVGAEVYDWEAEPGKYPVPTGKLAIGSKDFKYTKESFRLVYRFVISSRKPFDSHTVDIDAKTEVVVNKVSNLIPFDVPSEGTLCNGGHTKQFTADKMQEGDEAPLYRLRMTGPPQMVTLWGPPDAKEAEDFIDGDNDFTDKEAWPGVSIHLVMQRVVIYFHDRFKWFGPDGQGNQKIESWLSPDVHSHYSPDSKIMYFESNTCVLTDPCHEFTHAVVDAAIPKFQYSYTTEAGYLDEGFADIFANLFAFNQHLYIDKTFCSQFV